LRENGKPVEMYVFPDEYHEKISPVHRLNSYNRSIDWFAFWLQGKQDSDPEKADQYRRWQAMRDGQSQKSGTSNNMSGRESAPSTRIKPW